MTNWAELQKASDNLAIQLVNLKVLENTSPINVCEGYDNTLERVIMQVENNRHTLRFTDCRTKLITTRGQ